MQGMKLNNSAPGSFAHTIRMYYACLISTHKFRTI